MENFWPTDLSPLLLWQKSHKFLETCGEKTIPGTKPLPNLSSGKNPKFPKTYFRRTLLLVSFPPGREALGNFSPSAVHNSPLRPAWPCLVQVFLVSGLSLSIFLRYFKSAPIFNSVKVLTCLPNYLLIFTNPTEQPGEKFPTWNLIIVLLRDVGHDLGGSLFFV